MPRKGPVERRQIGVDAKYKSTNIQRFINRLIQKGKKSIAQRVVYAALDRIEERSKQDPLEVFKKAIKNATPLVKVKARRIGGSTYQVPIEVAHFEGESIGSRWIIRSARKRPGKSIEEKLAAEFMDAANGQGAAVKKRDETHRMAEANKAFAHYRF